MRFVHSHFSQTVFISFPALTKCWKLHPMSSCGWSHHLDQEPSIIESSSKQLTQAPALPTGWQTIKRRLDPKHGLVESQPAKSSAWPVHPRWLSYSWRVHIAQLLPYFVTSVFIHGPCCLEVGTVPQALWLFIFSACICFLISLFIKWENRAHTQRFSDRGHEKNPQASKFCMWGHASDL